MKSILTFFAETDALLSAKLDEHLGGGEFLAGDHHCLWCQPCRNWRQQNMEGGIFSHLIVFTDAHVIVRKRFFSFTFFKYAQKIQL